MRKPAILVFSLVLFLLCGLREAAYPQTDEKTRLLDSPWGTFHKAKKSQTKGSFLLKVWNPHLEYQMQIQSGKCVKVTKPPKEVFVVFDEVWTAEEVENLSSSERRQKKGKLNRRWLYWLDNKVQAWCLEKYYAFDPVTKKRVMKHEITRVADRDEILKGL